MYMLRTECYQVFWGGTSVFHLILKIYFENFVAEKLLLVFVMTIRESMNTHTSNLVPPILRSKTTILDKSLSRGKQEVSLSSFALLFSETVQYCQVSQYCCCNFIIL